MISANKNNALVLQKDNETWRAVETGGGREKSTLTRDRVEWSGFTSNRGSQQAEQILD
jgi:hypothetical protein